MATALIQSLVNGINPVVGASRDDLRAGDTVTLTDVGGPAASWAWSIAFAPEDKDRNPSSAVLAGNIFGAGPVTFVVDNEGPYLIRLVVDAGLPTQDEQYVRLRYDTFFGDLALVAAGERRDGTGIIPVDISAEGWANDQNFNLNRLLCLVQHVAASGRIIYVDANRGKDNLNVPNDPTIAEGFADFSTITAAILAAETNNDFNGGIPPSATQPVIVAVRPGFYEEDVEFKRYVHIIGWPSNGGGQGDHPDFDRSVTVRCANAGGPPTGTHTINTPNLGEYVYIANMVLENTGATTNALARKIGEGDGYLINCELLQSGGGAPSQGAGISIERGRVFQDDCRTVQGDTFSDDSLAFDVRSVAGTSALIATNSFFTGPSLGTVDSTSPPFGGVTALFDHCSFSQVGIGAGVFGIQSWSEDLILDNGCVITVDPGGPITDAIELNPDFAAVPGDLSLTLRRTLLGDTTTGAPGFLGISIDDTNVGGTSFLRLGSSEYGTISQIGSVTRQALTIGTSLFYDNTASGLVSENVQDAIDEIAGGGGGGAAPSTAPFITHAVTGALTDYRILGNGIGTIATITPGNASPAVVDLAASGVAASTYRYTTLAVDIYGRALAGTASEVVEETYSRQMFIPTAAFAPPLIVQEFDIINIGASLGMTVAPNPPGPPGSPAPLQLFWAVGGPFPVGSILQVYVGPFGGPVVPIGDPAAGPGYSPAGYDLGDLVGGVGGPIAPGVPVGAFVMQPVAQLGFVIPPGIPHMILIEMTYSAPAPVGTDGLTISVTGTL
jgi:hypothetical protein